MTVKELKQQLENLPDLMEVFVDGRVTDFTYGLVNSAKVKEINFTEDPGGKPLCSDKVLVLSEE